MFFYQIFSKQVIFSTISTIKLVGAYMNMYEVVDQKIFHQAIFSECVFARIFQLQLNSVTYTAV